MAKSTAERKRIERTRFAAAGFKPYVVYADKRDHAAIREFAKQLRDARLLGVQPQPE
jgi:hypothetical protein